MCLRFFRHQGFGLLDPVVAQDTTACPYLCVKRLGLGFRQRSNLRITDDAFSTKLGCHCDTDSSDLGQVVGTFRLSDCGFDCLYCLAAGLTSGFGKVRTSLAGDSLNLCCKARNALLEVDIRRAAACLGCDGGNFVFKFSTRREK